MCEENGISRASAYETISSSLNYTDAGLEYEDYVIDKQNIKGFRLLFIYLGTTGLCIALFLGGLCMLGSKFDNWKDHAILVCTSLSMLLFVIASYMTTNEGLKSSNREDNLLNDIVRNKPYYANSTVLMDCLDEQTLKTFAMTPLDEEILSEWDAKFTWISVLIIFMYI